jgi:hypothetical protein
MFTTTMEYFRERPRRTDGAVNARWTTAAYTIFPEGLDATLFDSFVARKACKVVAGEIKHLLASIDDFGPGSVRLRPLGWTKDPFVLPE